MHDFTWENCYFTVNSGLPAAKFFCSKTVKFQKKNANLQNGEILILQKKPVILQEKLIYFTDL